MMEYIYNDDWLFNYLLFYHLYANKASFCFFIVSWKNRAFGLGISQGNISRLN